MANVNLKVMMRLGDNRTAQDMADWVGKVATTKRSLGTGVNHSVTSRVMKGPLDAESRKTGAQSQSIHFSEDEEDLVSSEELKHEMAAEKGLAWFDLGDGRILKGRCLWFNAVLPETWEGREFITRHQKIEMDEVGLADWVDEQILDREQMETVAHGKPESNEQVDEAGTTRPKNLTPIKPEPTQSSSTDPPKRFTLAVGGRNRGRGRVMALPKSDS
jgi:hypothetical protein